MQAWFNVLKSSNIICHRSCVKEENHIIFPVETKNSINLKHQIMTKNSLKTKQLAFFVKFLYQMCVYVGVPESYELQAWYLRKKVDTRHITSKKKKDAHYYHYFSSYTGNFVLSNKSEEKEMDVYDPNDRV